jgi:hypothetical protein
MAPRGIYGETMLDKQKINFRPTPRNRLLLETSKAFLLTGVFWHILNAVERYFSAHVRIFKIRIP